MSLSKDFSAKRPKVTVYDMRSAYPQAIDKIETNARYGKSRIQIHIYYGNGPSRFHRPMWYVRRHGDRLPVIRSWKDFRDMVAATIVLTLLGSFYLWFAYLTIKGW